MWPRRRDATVAALLALVAASAAAQGLYLEGGVSLARGDYVYTERTSSGGGALGLAWSSRRLTARVTLPFFVRDARLLTLSGAPLPEQTETLPSETGYEGSVSDPLVQVYVQVFQRRDTGLGVSASVKPPLVEAGSFGTGEWDASASASLSQFVGPRTMLGLDVGYWHLGDMTELPLDDTVTATLTVGQALGRDWTASLSLSGAQSSIAGFPDAWWVGLLAGRSFSRGMWGLTASVGLSDGAPDFTAGLVWRARLH